MDSKMHYTNEAEWLITKDQKSDFVDEFAEYYSNILEGKTDIDRRVDKTFGKYLLESVAAQENLAILPCGRYWKYRNGVIEPNDITVSAFACVFVRNQMTREVYILDLGSRYPMQLWTSQNEKPMAFSNTIYQELNQGCAIESLEKITQIKFSSNGGAKPIDINTIVKDKVPESTEQSINILIQCFTLAQNETSAFFVKHNNNMQYNTYMDMQTQNTGKTVMFLRNRMPGIQKKILSNIPIQHNLDSKNNDIILKEQLNAQYDFQLIKELIMQYGVDPKIYGEALGWTAVHLAAYEGDLDFLSDLCAKNPEIINIKSQQSEITPLCFSKNGCCAIMMLSCSHRQSKLINFTPKLLPSTSRMNQCS